MTRHEYDAHRFALSSRFRALVEEGEPLEEIAEPSRAQAARLAAIWNEMKLVMEQLQDLDLLMDAMAGRSPSRLVH